MVRRIVLAITAACVMAAAFVAAQTPQGPRFEIAFSSSARSEAVTGRVYVAFARESERVPGRQGGPARTPIELTGPTGTPLFSAPVDALAPGAAAVIDATHFGHPVQSLRDIPAGEYWVQPFVNVYTKFVRKDGHTVWMHMDQWEGQDWKRSPGNLYGEPVKITFDPQSTTPIRLVADKVIPPIEPPADTAQVKRFRIQSRILSEWWGHPIYIGATVLLPRDYEKDPATRYPAVYIQGHFSTGAPAGFGRGGDFDTYWMADGTPRMIYITLQHPSPYYDDSYGVNSENNGPYGDAIVQELIPEIESRFRVEREPWARILSGGSTGGWIALAHQIFYPDFYGGTFSLCPDGVDFRAHQIVNIYEDTNAYVLDRGWMQLERPNQRRPDGSIQSMMKDENWYELVVGDKSRSGGQWDIWEATFSPVGADGYPKRLWDKRTGVIDTSVAEAWKKYDLRHILETEWTTLGAKVAHKINVYMGDMDSYYLNNALEMMNAFLAKAQDPPFTGEIVFERKAPHCWGPRGPELHQKIAAYLLEVKDRGR
ncbi:MAG TPA: alpha/beta hydrolase-fold protein [Vicinamibacterales bacterium]|nr:alpha/beta hydrolase-fold protein [Vicinamibacterales bacterium]